MKPIIIKLTSDGTVLKNSQYFTVYTLYAFEKSDREYPSPHYHVILSILGPKETYENINKYFQNLHKRYSKYY